MFRTEPKKTDNTNYNEILGVSKNAWQDRANRKAAIMKKIKELSQPKRDLNDQPVVLSLMLSLEDLYNGTTMKKHYSRFAFCSKCKGKGSKSGASMKCSDCQGSGMKLIISQGMCPCYQCKSTGETISDTITDEDRCEQCKGEKVVLENDALEVHVEKGMQNGQKITFTREVLNTIGGGGIVYILQQKEHPKFKRKGDDLFVEHTLSFKEALCGFQFRLAHLDNRQLIIKSQPGEVVKPGQLKEINDEGMPVYQNPFMRGKLYIHFTVEFPDSLTPDQVKAVDAVLTPRPSPQPVLPPRPSPQLTDMNVDECEETTLHDDQSKAIEAVLTPRPSLETTLHDVNIEMTKMKVCPEGAKRAAISVDGNGGGGDC